MYDDPVDEAGTACLWWFGMRSNPDPRYYGVRVLAPAAAVNWPTMLFMLSNTDPGTFDWSEHLGGWWGGRGDGCEV